MVVAFVFTAQKITKLSPLYFGTRLFIMSGHFVQNCIFWTFTNSLSVSVLLSSLLTLLSTPLPSAMTVKFPNKISPEFALISSCYIEAGTSCCSPLSSNFHNLLEVCKFCVSSLVALHGNALHCTLPCGESNSSIDGSLKCSPCVPPKSLSSSLAFFSCFSSSLFVEGPQPAKAHLLQERKQKPPSLSVVPFFLILLLWRNLATASC